MEDDSPAPICSREGAKQRHIVLAAEKDDRVIGFFRQLAEVAPHGPLVPIFMMFTLLPHALAEGDVIVRGEESGVDQAPSGRKNEDFFDRAIAFGI